MPDVASPAAERKLLSALLALDEDWDWPPEGESPEGDGDEPPDMGGESVPIRSISICLGKDPSKAPTLTWHRGRGMRWHWPRSAPRIDSRPVPVPVVRPQVYRAPRRRRIARSGGSRAASGLDPPGPGNGTAARGGNGAAAIDQGLPKWALGTPSNTPAAAEPQDGDLLDELITRVAARLIDAVPPPGSALWFWREGESAWIVDSISVEKAATFPVRGRA
jgi:hypothetical protein